MKNRIVSVLALALSLAAASALAQDNSQNNPANPPGDQTSTSDSASATTGDQQQMPADAQQQSAHRHRHSGNPPRNYDHDTANMALTGNEPGTAAYQQSDQLKAYPPVDHGHVPGDPPVIDHSGDQTKVTAPTSATITQLPPQH